MSATYRIESERVANGGTTPWRAYVWRLSDEELMGARYGTERAEVEAQARELVRSLTETDGPYDTFVDDTGADAAGGHSVKA